MTTPDAGQRLIEDLRKCARESTSMYVTSVAIAAADEIERLRGVEEKMRETFGAIVVDVLQGDYTTIEAFAHSARISFATGAPVIDTAIAASRSTGAADVGEEHG